MKDIMEKLKILADGAKYDVSCSTSGVARKNSGKIGSASCAGICHSWSADGRCISLLKVLFTNKCAYDCEYCVNRRSADVERASFEPDELARLAIEFYRRNYIEGLFLSSAVENSPDYTSERMLNCLSLLRDEYGFAGYIHAKIVPGVSREILRDIGMVADRLSVNIELPTEKSLRILAPQKKKEAIFSPMRQITDALIEQRSLKGPGTMFKGVDINTSLNFLTPNPLMVRETAGKYKEKFAPAGQTTQMLIGAGGESDRQIIKTTEGLYKTFAMKRVYFSAYIPVRDSPLLPSVFTAPPLSREHRLYQADWLLRFYGFTADEILDESNPDLDPDLDPKIAWALRNIEKFPIEVNKAPLEEILKIPGVGMVSALRIVRQRRITAVKYEDLIKMGVVLKRAGHFLTCNGKYYGGRDIKPEYIREEQISMFQGAGYGRLPV